MGNNLADTITPAMIRAGVEALLSSVDGCSTLEGFAGQAEWTVKSVFEAMSSRAQTPA